MEYVETSRSARRKRKIRKFSHSFGWKVGVLIGTHGCLVLRRVARYVGYWKTSEFGSQNVDRTAICAFRRWRGAEIVGVLVEERVETALNLAKQVVGARKTSEFHSEKLLQPFFIARPSLGPFFLNLKFSNFFSPLFT